MILVSSHVVARVMTRRIKKVSKQ